MAHELLEGDLAMEPGIVRAKGFKQAKQARRTLTVIGSFQVGNATGWSLYYIGKAHTFVLQQQPHGLRPRLNRSLYQPAGVQRLPEAVARVCKIEPCRH